MVEKSEKLSKQDKLKQQRKDAYQINSPFATDVPQFININ